MQQPQIFFFDESGTEAEAAEDLALKVGDVGAESPFVLASVHGATVSSKLAGPSETPPPGADQEWAGHLGSRVRRAGADILVGVGGGRCIDVAKLAAARAGVPLVAVPTQLSHDGICSPVATVPDNEGRPESVGAIDPRAVYLSIPTLVGAPPASVAAGIGDLLANPLALRDWALAVEHGLEEMDQQAWDLSVESFRLIEPYLETPASELAGRPDFLRTLADALVLSGMSMIASGNSRPASGGEHEISHALDELFGGRALHGAQVAFGCIFSVALHGEDTDPFRARLRRIGLPDHPRDLDLDTEDVLRVLLHAPDTRPGRFTIVEHADLDASSARALIERIWGHD